RSFQKALEIDPDNPHAHLGLSRSLLPRRKNRLAAESALATVHRMYNYPMAHYCLGQALARLGQPRRALEALRMAVTLNPNFPQAHRQLARLYRGWAKDLDLARDHLNRARALESHASATDADELEDANPTMQEGTFGLSRQELAASHLNV